MSSRRTARVAQAIRETVSSTILFELRDPRIRNVTVLSAEVSGDLRNAKVHVSVMGGPKVQALTMHGLNAARGFVQAKVADRLQTKVTPVLQFVLDTGVQRSIEASRMLRELLPDDGSDVASGSDEAGASEDFLSEDGDSYGNVSQDERDCDLDAMEEFDPADEFDEEVLGEKVDPSRKLSDAPAMTVPSSSHETSERAADDRSSLHPPAAAPERPGAS